VRVVVCVHVYNCTIKALISISSINIEIKFGLTLLMVEKQCSILIFGVFIVAGNETMYGSLCYKGKLLKTQKILSILKIGLRCVYTLN
jgi:hypothetical protein